MSVTLRDVVRLRTCKRVAGVAFALAAAVLALAVAAWGRSSGISDLDSIVKGTNGPDVLTGTPRGDILEGLSGADRLYGRGEQTGSTGRQVTIVSLEGLAPTN